MASTPGYQDLAPKTPRSVPLSTSATSITLREAKGHTRFRILSMRFSVSGAGTLVWKSDNDTLMTIVYAAAAQEVMDWNPDGWVESTEPGHKLYIENGSGLTISGNIRYIEV